MEAHLMTIGYTVLSIAYVQRPTPGRVPLTTLLAGATVLDVAANPTGWTFDLDAHTSLAGDDEHATMRWIAERAWTPDRPLLLWRAGDIVVPALIAAAESCTDASLAAEMLRTIERLLTGPVIDVADLFGGAAAISFDAVAHDHHVPFEPMSKTDLEAAWHVADHDRVRRHLAARASGTFGLWLKHQDQPELRAAFEAGLGQQNGEAR
jgi:hypothetical protein